jgi:hypothetical protein
VKRGLLAVLFAAAFLLVTAPAQAAIELGKGIGGVELGMSAKQVFAAKGEPDKNEVIGEPPFDVREVHYGKLLIYFNHASLGSRADFVRTSSRAQRTPEGAGVGWSSERLEKTYPRIDCESDFPGCRLGKNRPGQRLTLFYVSKRTERVSAVAVTELGPHESN